jgi:hypothetical protein
MDKIADLHDQKKGDITQSDGRLSLVSKEASLV